ncbi:T-cell immunoglobulin and mucin domain-containing protein 4-like [Anolis sagrei]|uniref:T-cell immunoglobulin and mucin domain-containing protein 4-like n=1 Tax=Anolis sagrei TaxID=38937 RepID=UPI003521CB8B
MQYSVLSTGTMLPCLSLRWSLLLTTTGFMATGDEKLVQGKIGQDLTLPCHYSVTKYGVTTMCWGRGSCPSSLCSDPIIWTDTSHKIIPQSSRYHLMGDIRHGDVSLTILNVTVKDAGMYCCRVEIPGLFNDLKIHVQTMIKKGSSGPTSLTIPEPTWISSTELPPDSTEVPPHNVSLYFFTLMKEQRKKEPAWTGLYVGIGVCSVLLIIVTLLLLKWYLLKKQKMTNSVSQMAFSNSGGMQQVLEAGVHALENVYDFHAYGNTGEGLFDGCSQAVELPPKRDQDGPIPASFCKQVKTFLCLYAFGKRILLKFVNCKHYKMHMLLFHWVMLQTCIVSTLSQNMVRGMVGQAINLPCTYHVRWASDLTDMCWGRGSCPKSKCNDEILRTNGRTVTSKISSRYHLKGYVTRGDVSLTIENLNERDKGLYCCRVEIRGWFNDIKKTLNLQVERATTTIFTTTITTTSQMTTTTLTTTSLTTTPRVPSTFRLTTKPTSTATTPAIDDPTLSTSSVSRNIAVTTIAPSFLFTTELASTTTAFATDGTTLPVFSVSRSIAAPTTTPAFLLTTKPASTTVLSTTDGLTLSTSSVSTASAFHVTAPPLLDTKSSPTSFQNDFITTETDSPSTGQTVWDFSKEYYPVLIPSALVICSLPLILVIRRMKCKKMGKYESDGMESLNKQEEEPEQTFSGTEGENGLFPL